MKSRGFQRSGVESELLDKGPLDALMVSDSSFSSSDEAFSIDPGRYEALINGQLPRQRQLVLGSDASTLTRGGADCFSQKLIAPVASVDPSTTVANYTLLRLPWFFTKSDQAPVAKADSLLQVVPVGLQSSHLLLDCGFGLPNNLPCGMPSEVIDDALKLSSGSSEKSLDAELETPLAVDYSFRQSQVGSFSVEDIWEDGKVDSRKVSKWVAAKLKGVAACLGVAFSGYEDEVANLLARIERTSVISKPSVLRTPSAVRRRRELKRLECGVNYEKAGSSSSGMLVPYV